MFRARFPHNRFRTFANAARPLAMLAVACITLSALPSRAGAQCNCTPNFTFNNCGNPFAQTICVGGTFSCSVGAFSSASGTSVQWHKNGVPLSNGPTGSGSVISGATGGQWCLGIQEYMLTITNVQPSDVGNYALRYSYQCGSSCTPQVTGLQPGSGYPLVLAAAPAVTSQPVAAAVCDGGAATLSVTATGSPAPTYQWRRNGSPVSGANGSSININPVNASTIGSYDCVVTNSCSSATSNAAVVSIGGAAAITTQPVSITVGPACPASFSVTASGLAPLTYQWKFNGTNIPGATSSTYTINPTGPMHAGSYSCTVTGCGTATSSSATLNYCPADFNCSGLASVQDIFSFLASYFAGCP